MTISDPNSDGDSYQRYEDEMERLAEKVNLYRSDWLIEDGGDNERDRTNKRIQSNS
jgi:hypothetical protein